MKFTSTLLTSILFAATTYAAGKVTLIKAEDASTLLPAGKNLGPKAEGCSVNAAGIIHATDGSDIINLRDGTVALKGPGSASTNPTSWLASSRFLKNGDLIAGDAVGHKVFIVQKGHDLNTPQVLLQSDKFLQPNDMAVTGCGRYLYFSGMNYTSDDIAGQSGELAWIDMWKAPLDRTLNKVSKQVLADGKVYRSNGIEVIDKGDQEFVYLTSAQNVNNSVVSTRIIKFTIDKSTGEPKSPTVALDIGKYLEENGIASQAELTTAGMDPDGMRADLAGNLYITLNAFKAVLRWNTETGEGVLAELKTVFFPTNLELGGKNGDEVYVVGKCEGNKVSCVDVIKFGGQNVGRAFAYLNGLGKKVRREEWRA
ncbi:hypothetical protein EV426DRAFT_113549 [Tirmania nivea]|nr:hypothetical protein EV426DRAFT_113549 [Tirmania nivea]